jgi:hypothetical protein
MSSKKQLPKRKTNPPKTTPPFSRKKKVKPLTAEEINFINNTEPSSARPANELLSANFLASSQIPASLIQQFLLFLESYYEYYTRDTFLKTFGISINTCKKWINEKGLPFIELDRIVLFKKRDVDDFFDRYRNIIPALLMALPGLF